MYNLGFEISDKKLYKLYSKSIDDLDIISKEEIKIKFEDFKDYIHKEMKKESF